MGVTSWGWEHTMCHRYPGVATRVASFVTWIKENAPAACELNVNNNAGGNMGEIVGRKAGEDMGGNTAENEERDTEGNKGSMTAAAVLGLAAQVPVGATAATTGATLAPTPLPTTTREEISGKN